MYSSIPQSNDVLLIFPYNSELNAFDCSFYSNEMTDNRVAKEEVIRTIYKMEKAVEQFRKGIRFGFTFMMTFMGLGLLVPPIFIDSVAVRIACPASFVFMFLFFYLSMFCGSGYNNPKVLRQHAQKAIDKANEDMKHRGLRWGIPQGPYPLYVELYKDYKFSQQYQPPQYVTNMNIGMGQQPGPNFYGQQQPGMNFVPYNGQQQQQQIQMGMNFNPYQGQQQLQTQPQMNFAPSYDQQQGGIQYAKIQGGTELPPYRHPGDDAHQQMYGNV